MRQRPDRKWASDHPIIEKECTRELASLDGDNAEAHSAYQGVFEAVGQEQPPGDLGEGRGRGENRVLAGGGLVLGRVHGTSLRQSLLATSSHA